MKFYLLLIDPHFILSCLFLKVQLFAVRYPLLYLFIISCFWLIFTFSLLWFVSDSTVIHCTPNSDSWTEDYFVGSSASQSHAHQASDPSQPPAVNYETKLSGGVGEARESSINVATGRNENNSNNNNVFSNNNNHVNIAHPYNSNSMPHSIRNTVRRWFFWYICESERDNYSRYRDFKPNWKPNTRIRAEIKQDFLNDLEKLKLQKHTISWFLNFRTRPRHR